MAAAADRAAPENVGKGGPRHPPRQYRHRGGRVCHTLESRTCCAPCPCHTGARGACDILGRPRRCSLSRGPGPRCGRGLVFDPRHAGVVPWGAALRGGDGRRDGSRQACGYGVGRAPMAYDGLDVASRHRRACLRPCRHQRDGRVCATRGRPHGWHGEVGDRNAERSSLRGSTSRPIPSPTRKAIAK
jgi:hypothetical protein